MSDPVQGYVKLNGGRLQHALLFKDGQFRGRIARYPRGADKGIWCSPAGIGSTFFAHQWNQLTHDELVERMEFFKELERLMPAMGNYWYGTQAYQCIMCGSLVLDRIRHWRWHNQSSIMLETLAELFPQDE